MMDHEFSSPRAEFSPPRQEFAPPRPEFTPPKGEQHAPGAEFAQSAAVPEPKKRRVNPLMLTAAAVASSAIILTPVSVSVRPSGPSLQLDAAQRAYMSELSAALDTQDKDWLIELSHDPRTKELIEFFVEADRSNGTKDGDFGDYSEVFTISGSEHFFSSFSYDDTQGLAYPYISRVTNKNTTAYFLTYIEYLQSQYDSPDFQVNFSRITDGNIYSGEPYHEESFDASFFVGESKPGYCKISDFTLRWDDTFQYSIPIEGTSRISLCDYDSSGNLYVETEDFTITGTYAYDPEKGRDNLPDSARYYLENGTALWSYSRNGIQTDILFEVKNGQTINDGQFMIKSVKYGDGLAYSIVNADQIRCTFAEDGDSVDDLLFHTFHYGR